MKQFANRIDAGQELAARLDEYRNRRDVVGGTRPTRVENNLSVHI
jgi:predicted phosphoribosyltransferase